MREITVKFEDGNIINTQINGTDKEIQQYYINHYFNFGIDGDELVRCTEVKFLN